MAIHSSILSWEIPWIEEPAGLQSMGSQSQTWLSSFNFKASEEEELQMTSSPPFLLCHHFQPLQAVGSLIPKLSCKYTYLATFWVLLNSHTFCPPDFCVPGHQQCSMQMGQQETVGVHKSRVTSAHPRALLSLPSSLPKCDTCSWMRLFRISRWRQQSLSSERGHAATVQIGHAWSQPW